MLAKLRKMRCFSRSECNRCYRCCYMGVGKVMEYGVKNYSSVACLF